MLVRGARQVGKTWAIRQLGKTFDSLIELNFEQTAELKQLFEGDLDPRRLIERIGAYHQTSIVAGKTLLFLDEIQSCPDALRALRFFHEKMPDLHIIAAGSLLEFALMEIPSFGVGRIESLFMYPMSFREFAKVVEADAMLETVVTEKEKAPLVFHDRLCELLRTFMVVGGFPEVVQRYRDSHDLSECGRVLDDLYTSLRDDFAKYRTRVPAVRLDETFRAAMLQAGRKFIYTQVSPEFGSREAKICTELLLCSGLLHRIVHSDAQGIPLGAQHNPKRFKILPCDTGLYHRICGLPLSDTLFSDAPKLVNTGSAAEIFAGTELLTAHSVRRKGQLHYWQKESREGNAEVDYVVQLGTDIVPVEVKAGTRGAMQSMRVFLNTHKGSTYGIRASLESFARISDTLHIRPLYALGYLMPEG